MTEQELSELEEEEAHMKVAIAASERTSITAWLRAQAFPANTRLCRDLADAIDRGEHKQA